jgi:deoxyribodipyrimidine photo-lyase
LEKSKKTTAAVSNPEVNIVWLKRDLRTQDHVPLKLAEDSALPYIILFLYEPSLIEYPDTSDRHLQFCYHSVKQMNETLTKTNQSVTECHGEAIEIFTYFTSNYSVQNVFSYRESGIKLTWKRDKAIKKILDSKGINWQQSQRDNVLRGIKNRANWDKIWYQTMNQVALTNTYSQKEEMTIDHPFTFPQEFKNILENYPNFFQPAGEKNGWKYLQSFVKDRGRNYNRHISKPTESRLSCGRISPYISWGNLSVKQASQFVVSNPNYRRNKRPFDGMLTRLKWHCHFIQKFEVECEYETDCLNPGYETMGYANKPEFLEAWKNAKTGYPLVDACMRAVIETGWINFRMRAMLVSFLCFNLDNDWRKGVYHLAQQFLDYEPGIHYPQFQMQAGTTGINTVRMYNPIKQSQDNDPEGIFIKKWVPELRDFPDRFIHEPWKATAIDLIDCGITLGEDYPHPIVDLKETAKVARAKIWGHRKTKEVRENKRRIVTLHTRNK